MVYSKWYPFDATVSPVYELANFSQVIIKINISPFDIHNQLYNRGIIKFDAIGIYISNNESCLGGSLSKVFNTLFLLNSRYATDSLSNCF
jgi:hypothetical protein